MVWDGGQKPLEEILEAPASPGAEEIRQEQDRVRRILTEGRRLT